VRVAPPSREPCVVDTRINISKFNKLHVYDHLVSRRFRSGAAWGGYAAQVGNHPHRKGAQAQLPKPFQLRLHSYAILWSMGEAHSMPWRPCFKLLKINIKIFRRVKPVAPTAQWNHRKRSMHVAPRARFEQAAIEGRQERGPLPEVAQHQQSFRGYAVEHTRCG